MDPSSYFISDVTVIFLEGTHLLNDTVVIDGVSNLILRGEGQVVIECSDDNRNKITFKSSSVTFNNLNITDCGAPIGFEVLETFFSPFFNRLYQNLFNFKAYIHLHSSLVFINCPVVVFYYISITNCSNYCIFSLNTIELNLTSVTLVHHADPDEHQLICCNGETIHRPASCIGGNIIIFYLDQECYNVDRSFNYTLSITDSLISNGAGYYPSNNTQQTTMSGVTIIDISLIWLHIALDSVIFSDNIGGNFASLTSYAIIEMNNITSIGANRHICPNAVPSLSFKISVTNEVECLYDDNKSLDSKYVYTSLSVNNSNFTGNIALDSAGIGIDTNLICIFLFIHSRYSVIIRNSVFTGNFGTFGSCIGAGGTAPSSAVVLNFTLKDVILSWNYFDPKYLSYDARHLKNPYHGVSPSCLAYGNAFFAEFDNVTVANHNFLGLYAFNSFLHFTGPTVFVNNTGTLGGGLMLLGFSVFRLRHANLSFIDNKAIKGAGIYIDIPLVSSVDHSLCQYQIEGSINSSVVLFSGNEANVTGDDMYGGNIGNCFLLTFLNFANSSNFFETIFKFQDGVRNTSVSSNAIRVCFCEFECGITRVLLSEGLYPGQDNSVNILLLGERGGLTIGRVSVKIDDDDDDPQIHNVSKIGCFNLKMNIFTAADINNYVGGYVSVYLRVYDSYRNELNFPLELILPIRHCPPGFNLTLQSFVCQCSSFLTSRIKDVTCDISNQSISHSLNSWIGYSNGEGLLVTSECPYDYCVNSFISFHIISNDSYNELDVQCALNRTGILCGGCPEGLSLMLGSNRCGDCTNNGYIALSLVFAVFGILLVVLLISLDLTVTVGTINGLLFYANIIKAMQLNYVVYFQWFISWLNLDFGIETCFFNGMTAITKTWLQFVFPIYLLLLVFLLAVFVRFITSYSKFQFITRWFLHINFINVFATILLLSYSKFIQIMFNVFSVSPVHCDNLVIYEWSFNGNLEYATGQHLYLLIFECIFVVIFVVPYTMFVIGLPVVEKLPVIPKCGGLWLKIKPFCDAYGSPYNDRYRFWTGLLIVCRIILVVPSSLLSVRDYSVLIIFIVIVLLALIVVIRGPYKSQFLIILEVWFLLNVLGVTSLSLASDQYGRIGAVVSVALTFITFIGIVIYHLAVRLKVAPKIKAKILKNKSYRNLSFISGSEQISLNVPNTAIGIEDLDHADYRHYRDSILELNDDK
jgi:hypothetical protein